MVSPDNPRQIDVHDFVLPFSGRLDPSNQWVQFAQRMPWEELGTQYAQCFSATQGRPALAPRLAIGAVLIQQMKGLTDEETVQEIRENPSWQYFLGYPDYCYRQCCDPSLLVTIRRRLGPDLIAHFNAQFLAAQEAPSAEAPADAPRRTRRNRATRQAQEQLRLQKTPRSLLLPRPLKRTPQPPRPRPTRRANDSSMPRWRPRTFGIRPTWTCSITAGRSVKR